MRDCLTRILVTVLIASTAVWATACGGGGNAEPDSDSMVDMTDVGPEESDVDADVNEELSIMSPESGTVLSNPIQDVEVQASPEIGEVTLHVQGKALKTLPASDESVVTFEEVDLSEWDALETPVMLQAFGSSDDDESSSPVVSVLVDSRKGAVEALVEASDIPPAIRWDRRGFPSFVQLDVPAPDADDPVEKGFLALEEWAQLMRIESPLEVLAPGQVTPNESGATDVLFWQHLDGIPVDSAAVVVSFDPTGERVLGLSGNFVRDLPELKDPGVNKEEAETIAREDGVGELGDRLFASGDTRQVVYDPAIYDPSASTDATLAWRVNVQGFDVEGQHAGYWTVFVDTQTGEVLLVVDAVREAIKDLQVKVLNAKGKAASDGASDCMSKFATRITPACYQNINLKSDGCDADADSDGDAADARAYAIDMHNWLDNKFGWISNDEGGIIKPFVNVSFGNPNAQSMRGLCNNQLQFSDDWVVKDIFHHEYGHRLVRVSGTDFNYINESGALDEHYADLFGALIEGEDMGIGFEPRSGQNLPGGELRDMQTPSNTNNPATYANRFTGSGDNGGVHRNSTIPSKATWLIAKGGQFQGYDIQALGSDVLREMAWKTLQSSRINSSSRLSDYGNAMVLTTRINRGNADACQVRNAFAAVGVVAGDTDCDGELNGRDMDNDADGTPDMSDNCVNIYNPTQKDQDGDNTGDACDADRDGDTIQDGEDNCPDLPNVDQDDVDDNGVGDACEDLDNDTVIGANDNCPQTENLLQTDTDGDGMGDACDNNDDNDQYNDENDNCPKVANSAQDNSDFDEKGDACDDSDGDGIVDADDPCPESYSLPNPDKDNDGLLDACEDSDDDNDGVPDESDNCRFTENESQFDDDEDGVGDLCDNCPGEANAEQLNTDGDGEGNACDSDDDGDGVDDGQDNCPQTANNRQYDSDNDGVGEACDEPNYKAWQQKEDIERAIELAANFPGFSDPESDPAGGIFTGTDFPIDVCKRAICRDNGYVPAGYEMNVDVSAGYPFRAAVVDGGGNVMALVDPGELSTGSGDTPEYSATLTIEPEAGAWYDRGSGEAAFQGETYKLKVVGNPEFGTSDAGPVSVGVSEGMGDGVEP